MQQINADGAVTQHPMMKNLVESIYSDEEIEEFEKQESKKRKDTVFSEVVPKRYINSRLCNFRTDFEKQRKARETCESFVDEVKKGKFRTLILCGRVGTGKTHLACGCIYELGGIYKNVFDILDEVRESRNFNSKTSERLILKKYGTCDFLVIDEIGRGFYSDDEKYLLYKIINERYNNKLSSLLISNKTKNDFFSYIGEASRDRLVESVITYDFDNLGSVRTMMREENI